MDDIRSQPMTQYPGTILTYEKPIRRYCPSKKPVGPPTPTTRRGWGTQISRVRFSFAGAMVSANPSAITSGSAVSHHHQYFTNSYPTCTPYTKLSFEVYLSSGVDEPDNLSLARSLFRLTAVVELTYSCGFLSTTINVESVFRGSSRRRVIPPSIDCRKSSTLTVFCTDPARSTRAHVAASGRQRETHLSQISVEMYHHGSSPSPFMTMVHNALPSPEYTGDSDSDTDIIQELEQKRRQLDEEIARFRSQKDKEFKDFEAELKARRQQRKAAQYLGKTHASNYYEITRHSPSTTPPLRSLSNGVEKKAQSPQRLISVRDYESIRLIKPNAGPKVTAPTICLDKLNIKGQNMPQSHVNSLQTPPTPTCVSSVPASRPGRLSSSEEEKHGISDLPSTSSDPPRGKPPFSPEAKSLKGAFAGFRAPAYLPLLDPRHDRPDAIIEGTQTEPASPVEQSIVIEAMGVHSSSMPTESFIPDTFQIASSKRAYTSPSAVNRRTLAPIIRNVNGRKRSNGKRKHVTFQLADRAIVEPSSSYEEGPSPDIDDRISGRRGGGDSSASTSFGVDGDPEPKLAIRKQRAPLDPFGRKKRTVAPVETPEEEIGMSMADLLLGSEKEANPSSPARGKSCDGEEESYFSPRHAAPPNGQSPLPASPSPEHPSTLGSTDDNAYANRRKHLLSSHEIERGNSRSPRDSPSVSRRAPFDEPVTGPTPKSPRFSPHPSPITRPMQRQYPGTLDDELLSETNNVGFFELDEELTSPKVGVPGPEHPEDEKNDEKSNFRRCNTDEAPVPREPQTGTSVPINIIKPFSTSVTNSWIGTFGH